MRPPDQSSPSLRAISLDEFVELQGRERQALIVDVRERHEHLLGTVPGALRLPRSELLASPQLWLAERSAPVVVYCETGARAEAVARVLAARGHLDVAYVTAGFRRWVELGLPVEGSPSLTTEQLTRYARHVSLRDVGLAGQARLLDSKVLLVGLGGLGSPVALYLAAAGVGTLGLVDSDVVDASNLQRQVIHSTEELGASKVASAEKTIARLNPDVRTRPFEERLDRSNVDRILEGFEVVVDGSDNFETRYLLNDACSRRGLPLVSGAVFRFEGQVTTLLPGLGPCYRCLYPVPPDGEAAPSCAEAGVLGVLPAVIGSLQATEVLKLLLGLGHALVGRLVSYDALSMSMRQWHYEADPACSNCGRNVPVA